ncbi:MAG: cation diffusion facilitator family transporter [Phycisphaerales bacterium]
MRERGSRVPIIAAMVANFCVAAAKFVAAGITGSSAMISEGIHSLADSGDSTLLLIGHRLSRRPPDQDHPFGHGKELYVWAHVVAVLIFAVGAGMSLYEGIEHIRRPSPLQRPVWSYSVLGVAFVFEIVSWVFAYREFRHTMHGRTFWESIQSAVDPSSVAVLLEDSAALVGLVLAAAGTALTHVTGQPIWDGGASVLIGLLLAGVAVILITVSRRLLIGQAADRETIDRVKRIVLEVPASIALLRSRHFAHPPLHPDDRE